jgi:hypothetical protein
MDTSGDRQTVRSFATGRVKNPFEEKLDQLMDDILEVHRVGVSMSFLNADDGVVTLVRAIKSHMQSQIR